MEEGYDYEVVGEVFSDLNCVICLKLMRAVIQMECTHGMCNGCFEKLAQWVHFTATKTYFQSRIHQYLSLVS